MIEVGLSAKRRMVEFEGHVPMLFGALQRPESPDAYFRAR